MKNSIFITLFSLIFLAASPLWASHEGPNAEVPGMEELRGIERAGAPKIPFQTDPNFDDWGQGEKIL